MKTKLNKFEQKALQQVINATNWVTGEFENEIMDGYREEMPARSNLAGMIYDTVMTCTTTKCSQIGRPISEIRFAGKAFIKAAIEEELDKWGY